MRNEHINGNASTVDGKLQTLPYFNEYFALNVSNTKHCPMSLALMMMLSKADHD